MFNKSVIMSTFSKLSTTADNLMTRTIQINSWMSATARALHQWSITIQMNFDLNLFMWCGWVKVCTPPCCWCSLCLYLRLRRAVFIFWYLNQIIYLTRSKWGESNYHYTCNISNQWTITNGSLANGLTRETQLLLRVKQFHSDFIIYSPVPPVPVPYLSLFHYQYLPPLSPCLFACLSFSMRVLFCHCIRCTAYTHGMITATATGTLRTIFIHVNIRI